MTANDWILPWFMLVRIMYIMLNMVGLFLASSVYRLAPLLTGKISSPMNLKIKSEDRYETCI